MPRPPFTAPRLLRTAILGSWIAMSFATLAAQTPPDPAPRSPQEFLGRPVGTDRVLADWGQIGDWFDELGARSPTVETSIVGTSTLGRPFRIAVVSSAENLARLDEIRAHSARIADPRGLTPAERTRLLDRATPILFVSCNMHSTEIAAAEMSMELAWKLSTSDEEPWATARREVVTVIIPTVNPDGLDDVVNWYRRIVDTPYESARLPELYQLYAGHDNNRDWFALSLEETKIVTRLLYSEWHPQVYWDVHQQGSTRERMFVPPFRDPMNPNLDPSVIAGIGALGSRAMLDLTRAGFTGISTGVTYDMWWNGGNRNVPVRHNIIGLLSEAASANLASPIFLSPRDLSPPRGIETGYAPSNRFPAPWPGGWWRLRDIIDMEIALGASLLGSLSREPRSWLQGALEVAERTIATGAREAPHGWLIPPGQTDGHALRRLIEILLTQGIEIGRAPVPFTADEVEYPAGTLVLPRSQPYGVFLRDLFEVQRYPDGPAPYDVAGWTLPFLFGVRRVEVIGPLAVTTEPVTSPDIAATLVHRYDPGPESIPFNALSSERGSPREVFGLPARDTASIGHLVTFLEAGVPVLRASGGDDGLRGGWIPLGDWQTGLIEGGKDPRVIASAMVPFGRVIGDTTPERLAAVGTQVLERLPRVGLYAPWTANMDEGWLRWTFEHVGYPYTRVRNARVRAGNLRNDFDVLILPSVGTQTIRRGRALGSVFPELSGGLDPEGSIAIEEFVRSGGTLIACASSCAYAIELFDLPVEDATRGEGASEFNCPGSVLRTVPTDSTFAAGLPLSQPIFFSRSSAFRPKKDEKEAPLRPIPLGEWTPHLHFPSNQTLLSGYIAKPEVIAGAAAWGSVAVGDGTIHLFGFRPHYRSWSHGSFWLLFRAICAAETPRESGEREE